VRALRKARLTSDKESSPLSTVCSVAQLYQIIGEEASVGEKLNWGLPQIAERSREAHRFTGHERSLRNARL
jgi:hypothetical protein